MPKDRMVFRRVNGRIVPIKKREGHSIDIKKSGQGAGLIAGGAVTAVGAGSMAAVATKKASQFRVQSRLYSQKASEVLSRIRSGSTRYEKLEKVGQMSFGFKISPKTYDPYTKTAASSALKSQGFRTLRKGFRLGGLAISAALIGTGIKRGYEGLTGRKADTREEVVANVAGTGATFALSSAYAHRMFGGGKSNILKAVKFGIRAAKFRIR